MPFKDMPLICKACGESFIFTAGEQEFYADKGFLNEPTRCPRCRGKRSERDADDASRRPAPPRAKKAESRKS